MEQKPLASSEATADEVRAQSAATLARLAFRLTILLIISVLWSGDTPAQAAGTLCLLFGAVVLWTAYSKGERPLRNGLNRWHEGGFLAVGGSALLLWFWSR